jgi:hypothetical protein
MLKRLATMTTKKMQAPVMATLCHIKTMWRVASLWRVSSKKEAARPVPSANPKVPTLAAWSRIIPVNRKLVTPMAFNAPNCFKLSTVKR